MGRRFAVLGLVLVVTLTCLLAVGASALAIQFGQPDGDDHPYVCLVVFYDAAGPAAVEDDRRADLPDGRGDGGARDLRHGRRARLVPRQRSPPSSLGGVSLRRSRRV